MFSSEISSDWQIIHYGIHAVYFMHRNHTQVTAVSAELHPTGTHPEQMTQQYRNSLLWPSSTDETNDIWIVSVGQDVDISFLPWHIWILLMASSCEDLATAAKRLFLYNFFYLSSFHHCPTFIYLSVVYYPLLIQTSSVSTSKFQTIILALTFLNLHTRSGRKGQTFPKNSTSSSSVNTSARFRTIIYMTGADSFIAGTGWIHFLSWFHYSGNHNDVIVFQYL